jgi:poly(U)-specific endoribonuclease
MILSHSFDWRGNEKKISSMWIGTSPEFELGIYTLCWFARPNARCPISLSGNKINIQTYAISRDGQKFVASAYPDL